MRAAGYSIAGDQGLEIRVGAKSFEGLLSCPVCYLEGWGGGMVRLASKSLSYLES